MRKDNEEIVRNTNKRALNISEAAEYACVSRGTIETWMARKLLPYEELPGTGSKNRFRLIRKADLDEFLDRVRVVGIPKRNETAGPDAPAKSKNPPQNTNMFLLPKSA